MLTPPKPPMRPGYVFIPFPDGEFTPFLDMREGDEIATAYNGPTPMHPNGYHRAIGYWRPLRPVAGRNP